MDKFKYFDGRARINGELITLEDRVYHASELTSVRVSVKWTSRRVLWLLVLLVMGVLISILLSVFVYRDLATGSASWYVWIITTNLLTTGLCVALLYLLSVRSQWILFTVVLCGAFGRVEAFSSTNRLYVLSLVQEIKKAIKRNRQS